MSSDRWRAIERLCHEALARDAPGRDAFLDEACGGDAELRREVESFLAQQPAARDFMETPIPAGQRLRAEIGARLWTETAATADPSDLTGRTVSHYAILERIGEGGMGVVYKARDTRLDRTVAIKVLPPDVSGDPDPSTLREPQGRPEHGRGATGSGSARAKSRADRRARFEREAKTVAGLNHPHICTLYDVGDHDGSMFLVMEYLAGQTLAERVEKGALPLEQALAVATDIADALSAAHRQGVVHRDLKPANVMLIKSGGVRQGSPRAKLLDFGLAKLTGHGEQPAAAYVASAAQPQPASLTGHGVVVGTLQYMAPEQIEGKPSDARTDLWAFGAILYEMLTGRRAFEGASVASLMTAIVDQQPPALATLQPLTPPLLDRLVRQCLAKDPDDRPDSAHDVANELRWLRESSGIGAVPGVQRPGRRAARIALVVAAGLSLVAIGAALMWFLPSAPPFLPVHSMLAVAPAETVNAGGVHPADLPTAGGSRTALAWTPDGRALVYVGRRGAVQQLYVRALDAPEARPLAKTEGAQVPAVSPDGQWVAFWAGGAIRKVALGGGPVIDLAPGIAHPPWGLAWDEAGTLFFGGEGQPIRAISAPNTVKAVTAVGSAELSHGLPSPLPKGRALLYTVRKRAWSWGDEEVVAQAPAGGSRSVLLRNAADARYVPTGHLVFLRQGRLFAVRFDPDRLQVSGQEVPLVDEVAQALASGNSLDVTGAGQFAVATTGALAWLRGSVTPYRDAGLAMVDRQGRISPLPAPMRSYGPSLRASPDGRRLAVTIRTLALAGLWFCDLETGRLTPRVGEGECDCPNWSPDGQRVAFWWLRGGQPSLAVQGAEGTAPPLVLVRGNLAPSSFTPDGRQIAVVDDPRADISIATVENGQAAVRPLLQTPEREQWAEFSPDGRWLAYGSRLSGRMEVWVKPYPTGNAVPVEAGGSPAWHPNGRELFYVSPSNPSGRFWMMAVDFTPGAPRPTIGRPRPLFQFDARELSFSCTPVRCYDVARDGQRFYVTQTLAPPPARAVTHINLVTSWFEELNAKVPPAR